MKNGHKFYHGLFIGCHTHVYCNLTMLWLVFNQFSYCKLVAREKNFRRHTVCQFLLLDPCTVVTNRWLSDQLENSFINPKSTGLFSPGAALGGRWVFPPLLCKIRSRYPRELKLTGLVGYIMFYKLRKFGSSTMTNDVIRTSLPKTMEKFGPP